MNQSQTERLQRSVGQFFVGRIEARGLDLVRFLHQGRDDESLPSLADLVAEELPPLRTLRLTDQVRPHLLAARGTVTKRRDIQVPEEGHGDGPRDGRGGHHEVVRIKHGGFCGL